jgi:cbb3-type cytochrome oxidase subunit 3
MSLEVMLCIGILLLFIFVLWWIYRDYHHISKKDKDKMMLP